MQKSAWLVFELRIWAFIFMLKKHSLKFYTVDSGSELDNF